MFTAVPAEIRVRIYHYVFHNSAIVICPTNAFPDREAALLFTCRTIYNEAQTVCYEEALYKMLSCDLDKDGTVRPALPARIDGRVIKRVLVRTSYDPYDDAFLCRELANELSGLRELTFNFQPYRSNLLGGVYDSTTKKAMDLQLWVMQQARKNFPEQEGELRCYRMFGDCQEDMGVSNLAEILFHNQPDRSGSTKPCCRVTLEAERGLWAIDELQEEDLPDDIKIIDLQISFDNVTRLWRMTLNDTVYFLQGYPIRQHLKEKDVYYDMHYYETEQEPEELVRWVEVGEDVNIQKAILNGKRFHPYG